MRSIGIKKLKGVYGKGDPPLPIPNREVKPFSADGTADRWESRKMPNSDGESYRDVTLSFLCLIVLSSCLILFYFISSCVLCTCSVFFFVLWCGCFSLSFLCFLLLSPWLCFFFFAVFSSAFFTLSVALFLRYSIFFFCPFFFLFLFSLVVVLCCLLALPVSACLIFLSLCLYSFSVPVPVSAGYGLVTCF